MSEDGGDDSPPRPKRKIKRVMIVSSASESDSEESVVVPGTRRKRLRVLSDEESSDSSGSSVVVAGVRRRRALPKLQDSDADSDDSAGWVTDPDAGNPATSTAKPTSGFASDSSEGNSDKCSICLLRFTDQETGTPENCEHVFCFDCITEWSKNVNTCPVDRIAFKSIIVRACLGGRVLRTEEVNVTERRSPSIEYIEFQDLPTNCEICHSPESEETILLCDGCDLGYHMACLTPPLTTVPIEQWFCPNCAELLEDAIHLSEVEDLFYDGVELQEGPRPSALRVPRNVRRSARNSTNTEQPSTSSGIRRASTHQAPTTSRSTRTSRSSSSSATRRQTSSIKRRRKRRKTKTIVIEYEIEGNGKFPITKRVTKRIKKRKTKRRPRTAARRTHVRESVRAKLAGLNSERRAEITQAANAAVGVQNLAMQRYRAGIPSLNLLGNPNQLDYFSDDEDHISEAATTAVATRPTVNILSAYRQARRKMISVPSPPHASAAPDVLSNILESQTLLHSKKSLVSISVDGSINIKLQTHSKQDKRDSKEQKVDLTNAEAAAKKAPTYPGQSRGGGGWGGGYRGSYPRDHPQNNANGGFPRGGSYDGNYGGGYQSRPGQNFNNYQGNARREEPEYFDSFPRRPHQFPLNDEPAYSDRPRRGTPVENNRGSNFGPPPPNFPRSTDRGPGRHSLNSSWPMYGGGGAGPRADAPPPQPRHSFGGFENPVDMRVSQAPPATAAPPDAAAEAPRQDKRQPPTFRSLPESQPHRPLTRPPVFNFPKVSEIEKSEDERSDSGLVIDTEKYDPTEPTNDDDSGDEDRARARPPAAAPPAATPPPPAAVAAPVAPLPPPPPPPALPDRVQTILAGIDTSGMNVSPDVLDDAVRQVLKEHRNLMAAPGAADARPDGSDGDSDGDCPNFSIYSATSVHIASSTDLTDDIADRPSAADDLQDLVQEDDDAADATPAPPDHATDKKLDAGRSKPAPIEAGSRRTEEEYKEKVSKRCPITTVTRNPIKIKLNTPSLIRRQVSLYDEEEASRGPDEPENPVEEEKPDDDAPSRVADPTSPDRADDSDRKIDAATTAQFRDTFTRGSPKITESPQKEMESADDDDGRVEDGDPGEKSDCPSEKSAGDKTPNGLGRSREDLDANSDNESRSPSRSPTEEPDVDKEIDNVEKMTESISETEDERSYTPCLDENKSTKDASFENDKDKGLEGLDTEMISEDEGNEMFSENEGAPSVASRRSPVRPPAESEEGEIPEKKKERRRSGSREDSGKKKKKKESKKEGKDRSKSKKKGGDVAFKKLSRSGKERNYRDRDKDDKKDRDRRGSDADARKKRREKRKDLERYDVRTVVTEKRRKLKDPFGRDVSPRGRSPTRSPAPVSPVRRRSPALRSPPRSLSPARRRSPSPRRRSLSPRRSPAFSRGRRSLTPSRRSPARLRRSHSRGHRSPSRPRESQSRGRKSPSRPRRSPSRPRRSPSPTRRTTSRGRRSPARRSAPRRASPARARSASRPRRRRSASSPRASPRRRSPSRRKRRRSTGASPAKKVSKKRRRVRSAARRSSPAAPRRRSPSPPAVRPPSPRTPPSPAERDPSPRPRADRPRRRPRDAPPPSKEVFTSGDNILVSVSFKEQERGVDGERRKRKEARRTRRKRRRAPAETDAAKPVAIIDLERSPFRELTPSPKNVIVLSDSDPGERELAAPAAAPPAPAAPPPAPAEPALGPQTPPEPAAPPPEPAPAPAPPDAEEGGSPDAYDPFEPTRSASASPARAVSPGAASPPSLTLEAAQRSNLSADEVLARRPLSPAEKVLALLQSQRAAEPEPPPEPPRPEPPRPLPKLFPGKPSPIKSNPVKPMQAARLPWPPSDAGASPYSPGSSDFGELFEPPAPRRAPKVKPHKRRGKAAAGDEENFKMLDELPGSAVALQVKNKFLKKLNRQERVVEEVKLVLKPHYNRRRVSKDDYKEILRRCVPKICHNKTGEINPTKIQALVEAYVKKFRKKHKLGIA
ncbi:PHD and RING finger domain-containing protein 1 [Aricia agestis]|uniref:PHD and RING finger domain-containing protein 1 n=1 Tax=Aricia agestis TaxID=91739 RepID=UPI001C20C19C|nr:PHD and RING finger domain-containing protein 1 [Aricia agestis]